MEVNSFSNLAGWLHSVETYTANMRQDPNYSILIFTHLKLCLADAIHNFK